ncbi:hypothetical protein Tco_0108134 [Tanacetum coccineum]
MFDIDYLTDSMNYIPVSLENQVNPHAGAPEVTNNAGTLHSTSPNVSKEEDVDAEIIVVSTAARNTTDKDDARLSSTTLKGEEPLKAPQQEKEAYPTDNSDENFQILAFRRELDAITQKPLGPAPAATSTSTSLVNSGSKPVNSGEPELTPHANPEDSDMP